MSVKVTAYFDRTVASTEGKFTLKDNFGNVYFDKLPARSGQKGFTTNSWVRGKSPIPFGRHRLWLRKTKKGPIFPTTPGGVGMFWPISNLEDSRVIVDRQNPDLIRMDIGLHPDNDFPSSIGCIVLVHETKEQKKNVEALFNKLFELSETLEYIDLVVL